MRRILIGTCAAMALGLVSGSQAADDAAKFPIEQFVLTYGHPHPDAPSLVALADTSATLTRTGNVLSATGTGDAVPVRLGDPLPRGTEIDESGLQKLLAATVATLNKGGIYGVVAFPSREQIDPQTKEDLRPAGDKTLKVIVYLSEVAEVRTVGKGERLRGSDSVSNLVHLNIANHSPLIGPSHGKSGSLIFKERLNAYLERLNRHGGRSVEAAISSTDEPGRVVLDYLVTESKPWYAYAQVSNTGTKATDQFRERVGYVNNQLFNRDDVLSFDYITSSISKANALFAAYDAPILYPDRLRGRAYGSWGNFDAEVIFASAQGNKNVEPETFKGSSWNGGGELVSTPGTLWGNPVSVVGGLNFQHVEVSNKRTQQKGSGDLLSPYLSVRTERASEVVSYSGSIGFEANTNNIPDNDQVGLGRLDTQEKYRLMRGEFQYSRFLEPLFFGIGNSRHATLAHEISFQVRGQLTFGDDRLIPQKEMAVGGFFTVRGYPESAVAGDDAYVANLEYRFHVPRALSPSSEAGGKSAAASGGAAPAQSTLFGRTMNWRPPRQYSRPDWDLIIRGFLDVGGTAVHRGTSNVRRAEDRDYTIMSTGVGAELQLRKNLNVRADLGYVLHTIQTGVNSVDGYIAGPNDTKSGDARLHFLVTFLLP